MATWLITGCSTGLGRALAEAAVAAGHNVVATARDAAKVADLAEGRTTVLPIALDVTVPAEITTAVAAAEERFGGVDVLVNNAGYGYRGAVEEGDEGVRTLFETHFFGPVELIKAVLPGMRARRAGSIVNFSSIGVQLMPVGSGYYSAAKAALEGVTGALRSELAPLGITVTTVEPGGFRTDFAGRSLTESSIEIADYADTAGKRRKAHDTGHGKQPGDPVKAAQAIVAMVDGGNAPAFLLLGTDALTNFRKVQAARNEEIAQWESVTTSTDITV